MTHKFIKEKKSKEATLILQQLLKLLNQEPLGGGGEPFHNRNSTQPELTILTGIFFLQL